jgi:hypothetical protein
MFAGNTEDPHLFLDYMAVKYPHLHAVLPEYGKQVMVDCTARR